MIDNASELWQFPCEFPIKIIGKTHPEFEVFTQTTILKHFPTLAADAITTRLSKDGSYIAITAMVTANSKAELDALYLELTANILVLMVL